MVDFSKLKASRGSNISKLSEKLQTMNKGSGSQKDERIFKPGFDKKEGKGYAVIRFLPSCKSEDPFVRRYSYMFQGPGGWYVENSRKTISNSEDDPVAISNALYWKKGENEGNEAFKNVARKRKRQTKYFANVYVIKDTIAPENEGKVMIYEFGEQIFKKINTAINPEFEDDESLDPFDMWTGANFKIKVVGKEMPDSRTGNRTLVPNYENSEFDKSSELFSGDDAKKEEIFNQTYDLAEFVKVKEFKDLAERFKKVVGEEYNALEDGEPGQSFANRLENEVSQSQVTETQSQNSEMFESSTEEEDDIMALFNEMENSAN